MEQLLLHLFGDYVSQTNWMAQNKTKNPAVAALHAYIYGLPFLLLTHSLAALIVIIATHFFIDYLRLARYVVFAKNWINEPSLRWKDCSETGYPSTVPPWMSVWLLIIADNFCHLAINYSALRWL